MMQMTPDTITIDLYSPATNEEVAASIAIWNVALAFHALPPSLHLNYMISIMHSLEMHCGFDWSAHGDCVIEAIAQRMREGEW